MSQGHGMSFALGRVGNQLSDAIGGSLWPLDRVRRACYAVLGRPLRTLLVDPERRAWWLGCVYLALTFAATLIWPLGLLALGPILWGIPHVVGDIRYLVWQPGHHENRLRLALVSLALLATILGAGIVAGCVAILLAVALSDATVRRRALLLVPGVLLLLTVCWFPRPLELVFAHLHNGVAVAWLLSCFERRWRRISLGVGFLVLVAALCALPVERAVVFPSSIADMDMGYHLAALTPPGESPWMLRLVFVFAFAQAFHYSVWIRLIPEVERKRRAPRGFRASYRALANDFGPWFVLAILLSMALLGVGALFALRESREAYLRFALFHGYLELCFIAVWWLERPRRALISGASYRGAP